LPTALKQAHLVKIVREDRIILELDTTGIRSGRQTFKLIRDEKESGTRNTRSSYGSDERSVPQSVFSENVPDTQGGDVTAAVFKIRLYGRSELMGKASVVSTRGGVLRNREFVIK
jgi:hypothetical protein